MNFNCNKTKKLRFLFTTSVLMVLTSQTALAKPVTTSPYELAVYNKQTVSAQLGKFTVPENRLNSDSRNIELSFVKLPSTNPTPGAPIVYLSGGPGGSATGTAKRSRYQLFNELRKVSDVILFDQRGTGLSNDLATCKTQPVDISIPSNHDDVMQQVVKDIKFCVKQWQSQHFDLNGYNTKQNAADLVALTKALGVKKINLLGISYGTHLAFTAAKYHPNIIQNMVLASVEGLDHTIKLPARTQDLLVSIDQLLKQQASTKELYPNLIDTIARVLNKVETTPVIVDTQDFSRKPVKVGIGKLDLQFALSFIFLRDREYIAKLPRMFNDMDKGNFAEIGAYVAYIKSMGASYNPMAVAMDTASGISQTRYNKVLKQAKTAFVGRTTNFPHPDLADFVPVNDLGDEFREEVKSAIPTLFLAGTLDGRTLYQSQIELTENFANKAVITVDGAGHNLFMSDPKVAEVVLDYFKGNAVQSHTISLPAIKFE